MKVISLHLIGIALLTARFHSTLSGETLQNQVSVSTASHEGHFHEAQYKILFNKDILRPQKEVYKYNEPADLIELIPVIRDLNRMIPRQFSLANHEVRLDPHFIRIQHEWLDVRTRTASKNSIISMTYSSPMGTFGSRLDVPLFYSGALGFSDWSRYPLGNYTMTLDRDNPGGIDRSFYIKAMTRF